VPDLGKLADLLSVLAVTIVVVTIASSFPAQTTWYLSLDQFGYLTFAKDLLAGRVFHPWPPMDGLAGVIPSPTDTLAQTYVWDGAKLYCRYAPGHPMLLAAWMGLFGEGSAFLLNPVLFVILGWVSLLVAARLLGSLARGAVAVMVLLVAPTQIGLWALTIARDVSVHLFAWSGLLLLLPRRDEARWGWRGAGAGLALGFAASIRPDAVLYLPAAIVMTILSWRGVGGDLRALVRAAAAGGAGLLVGALPLLAYNGLATGNPLRMTQGMEVRDALDTTTALDPFAETAAPGFSPRLGFPPPAWRGGVREQVQGGGLRLAHMPRTIPRLADRVRRGYGPLLLVLGMWGLVCAVMVRPALAAGALAYGVPAFLFYGCWPRADPRYLVGVFVFLPMLITYGVFGTVDLARRLRARGRADLVRGMAIGVTVVAVLGMVGWQPPAESAMLRWLFHLLPFAAIVSAVAAAATADADRVTTGLALALVIAMAFLAPRGTAGGRAGQAPFGEREMRLARMNFQRLLDGRAVVITDESVGRPAENIEYYLGDRAHALYLTDLRRWHLSLDAALVRFLSAGLRPFLFVPHTLAHLDETLLGLRNRAFEVERVARVDSRNALVHFVASQGGVSPPMDVYRIAHPKVEARLARRPRGS